MKYYIQSIEHGPVDFCWVFWGPDNRGYTTDLRRAGIYDEDRAREIVEGARGDEIAWPVDVLDAAAQHKIAADLTAPQDTQRCDSIVWKETP